MFVELIENLPKIMRALTFWRTVFLILLAVTFTALYTAESRQVLITSIKAVSVGLPGKAVIRADANTVAAIKSLVERSMLISGVQIVNADFRSNTRTTAYFFADRRDLQVAIDQTVYNRVAPMPLFMNTTQGPAEQRLVAEQSNARLIEVIRAEFVCFKTETTNLGRAAPEIVTIAPFICSISIPPYAGKFSGYLNVYLSREPTDDEFAVLKEAAIALSSDIFDREIAR